MKKTVGVILILSVLFLMHQTFAVAIEGTAIYRYQVRLLHWRYLHQAVFFFGVPALALVVLRRRPSDYGLVWDRNVPVGIAKIMGLTLVVPLLVDALVGSLRPAKPGAGYLLATLVFQTVFSGCGEELGFRGMYQGEMNRVSKKRFKIGETRFGPGLVVAAVFFGLGHLGIVRALKGGSLHYVPCATTFLIGAFLGFTRELVGCIWIVGFLHASLDTYPSLVQTSVAGRVAHSLGIGIVCYLLFRGRIYAKKPVAGQQDGRWEAQ